MASYFFRGGGGGVNPDCSVCVEGGKKPFYDVSRLSFQLSLQLTFVPFFCPVTSPSAHPSSRSSHTHRKPSQVVDKCMGCGFCESVCASLDLSLTPRQRITVQREISRLRESGENPKQLKASLPPSPTPPFPNPA